MTNNFLFGPRSREKIRTLHPDLIAVVELALTASPFDFTIVCGHRSEEQQDEAFATGHSKKKFPNSRHNSNPSTAVDIAPWIDGTIPWNDTGSFYILCGVILCCAAEVGVKIRSGCDWSGEGLTRDQNFNDCGHYELG